MYFSKVIKVGLSLSLLALLMPVSLANAEVRGEAVIRDSSPGLSDELSISLTMPILPFGWQRLCFPVRRCVRERGGECCRRSIR